MVVHALLTSTLSTLEVKLLAVKVICCGHPQPLSGRESLERSKLSGLSKASALGDDGLLGLFTGTTNIFQTGFSKLAPACRSDLKTVSLSACKSALYKLLRGLFPKDDRERPSL